MRYVQCRGINANTVHNALLEIAAKLLQNLGYCVITTVSVIKTILQVI